MEIRKLTDISIIIPFFRGNKYINTLLECIYKNKKNILQTLEVILVNDSPNVDIQIKPKFIEKLDIVMIKHENNKGIHAARVTGLSRARGEYIIFLDQDDLLMDNAICSQIESIGNEYMVCANAYIEQSNGVYKKLYKNNIQHKMVNDLIFYLYLGNRIVSPGQVMLKKDLIPKEWKHNLLINNCSDDLYLWILLLNCGCKFALNNQCIYTHRYTGVNCSGNIENVYKSASEMIGYIEHNETLNSLYISLYKRRLNFEKAHWRICYLWNIDIILFKIMHKIISYL